MKNNYQPSTLYLVPTPIGNLSDITFRAVEVLKQVDFIYSEDTRTSGVLLKHYNVTTPQRSYHKFNEKERCSEIINLLKEGKNIAIISDAGTPGISDPSNIIVKEALKHEIKVCPLPGATALIPALVASGFDTEQFYMAGFFPNKEKDRTSLFQRIKTLKCPIIIYESPNRINKTLNYIKDTFQEADLCIAREISKIYETFYRGKLSDLIQNIDNITLKGEFVIILKLDYKEMIDDLNAHIIKIYENSYKTERISMAAKSIAKELGIEKSIVYEILTKLKQ